MRAASHRAWCVVRPMLLLGSLAVIVAVELEGRNASATLPGHQL